MQTLQKPAASPLTAGSTTGKQLLITNNTDTDVVVIKAFTDEALPTRQLYEQSLQLLQTADGAGLIRAGAEGSFNFDKELVHTIQSLIVAKADNLSPVKTLLLVADSTGSYPDVAVSDNDILQVKLAAKFIQSITAFPSSSLATGYTAALSDKDTTAADTYLKSTDEYKTLTLDAIVAVQTYYTAFPFVWASFKADQDYYLYSSDGSANTQQGQVALHNGCISPVNPDKPLAGFAITYTKDGSSKPLYYLNGQFVDDINSNKPAVCLQGLFMVKSQLTKNDKDTAIVGTLTGSVGGVAVIGVNEEMATADNEDGSDGGIFHFPKDTEGWIALSALILVGVLGMVFLTVALKMTIDMYRMSKNPPSPAEIQAALRERIQKILDKVGDRFLKLPEDVMASLDGIKAKANEALLEQNKAKLRDIVDRQSATLEKVSAYASNDDLQQVYDKLMDINDRLLDTQAKHLGDAMEGMLNDLKSNAKILNTQANKVKGELGATEKKAIDDSKRISDDLTAKVEENERIREELREDEIRDEAFEFLDEF